MFLICNMFLIFKINKQIKRKNITNDKQNFRNAFKKNVQHEVTF